MHCKSKHDKPHYPVLVFRVAALLACLTLITTYLLSGAYSKFFSGASGSDSTRVARFSPNFTSTIITVENQLPGFPDVLNNFYEIPFTVQNFSGDKISETAMKCTIVLKTTGNIPLTFTLKDSSDTPLKTWNCDGTSGEQIYKYTDSSLVFGVGTKKTVDYKLKIEWLSDKNNARFSGMTDAVYLEAVFEQVD